LQLQLSLPLSRSLKFGSLRSKLGFLLLRLFLYGLFPAFLFLFLDFPLLDLLL